MTSSDSITVLHALGGALLAKRITEAGIEAYDRATWFAVEEIGVAGIIELGKLLARLERDPHACVIRGRPLPGASRERCRRLLYAQVENGVEVPATFESAARRWLALDIDSLPTPVWDPEELARRQEAIARDYELYPDVLRPDLEGDADPAPISATHDPELLLRNVVRLLPPEFADAHCWWQLTASAGFKPGIRIRLWYWLGRAVSDEEARRWLVDAPVDHAIFSPVQPIYSAAPVFSPPSLDPVPVRSGMWWRHVAAVPVPALPEPELPPPPPPPEPVKRKPATIAGDHRDVARQCLVRSDLTAWERELCTKVAALDTLTAKQAEALATIADPLPAKAEAYAKAALVGVATATTSERRHPTLMAVAVRLFSLADAGLLDHADITYRLLAAAEQPLTAAERHQRCTRHGGRPSANEQAIDWARARARVAPDLPQRFEP